MRIIVNCVAAERFSALPADMAGWLSLVGTPANDNAELADACLMSDIGKFIAAGDGNLEY